MFLESNVLTVLSINVFTCTSLEVFCGFLSFKWQKIKQPGLDKILILKIVVHCPGSF